MISLNEYIITESSTNYKDDFEKVFNEIKDLNTNYKIQKARPAAIKLQQSLATYSHNRIASSNRPDDGVNTAQPC